MREIRLGLIGCGTWGVNYLRSATAAGCVVTHVARGGGAERLIDHVSGPTMHVDDWRTLLDAPVDAIVCAAPPSAHEEIATYFLNNHRPVMCEKPMTLTRDAAEHILGCARESGVPFLVNHQHLFSTAYEEILARTAGDHDLGITSAGGGTVSAPRDYSALWDMGSHDIAMALGFTGAVRTVSASVNGGVYSVALSGARARAIAYIWRGNPRRRSFTVHTWRGAYFYDAHDHEAPLRYGPTRERVEIAYEPPLTRSLRAFVNAVRTGHEDWRFSTDLAYQTVDILARAETLTGLAHRGAT